MPAREVILPYLSVGITVGVLGWSRDAHKHLHPFVFALGAPNLLVLIPEGNRCCHLQLL